MKDKKTQRYFGLPGLMVAVLPLASPQIHAADASKAAVEQKLPVVLTSCQR